MTFRSPVVVRLILAALTVSVIAACDSAEPKITTAKPLLRQLTEEQYRNIVADVFGPQIVVAGAFDPILRKDALINVSAGNTTISASSFEKYEKLAHGIASQAVDPTNRKLLIGCEPAQSDTADEPCARQFLTGVGRFLFRRPLTDSELEMAVGVAANAATSIGDFHKGLAYGLSALMVSPHFLFISDQLVPNVAADEPPRLTAYSKAARLSFFLWNTTPDQALLDAAAKGDLETARGLKTQIERLMASPYLERGVRALFADMLEMEKFDQLNKDPVIYPAFDTPVIQDAREQLLRTITHHLLGENADYRSLFDTRQTFMTAALGRIYRVAVADLDGWSSFEFPATSSYTGIQTLAGFIAPHSHPGRSSPTIRGRAVRELLLCQKVPDPPGDIDFSLFNEPSSAQLVARERLAAHNSVPSCAGCHKITDGIGLALENFDGAGQFRTTDVGQPIDISGDLDGTSFDTIEGMAAALHDHPMIPACLIERTVSYALAGTVQRPQSAWESYLAEQFQDDGYRLKPLLKLIANSKNFFTVNEVPVPSSAPEPVTDQEKSS